MELAPGLAEFFYLFETACMLRTMLLRRSLLALSFVSLMQAFGACTDTQPGDVGAERIAINVVPNALPGVSDACYWVQVRNAAGRVQFTRGHVCSSRYGTAAGDISYVGPCDPTSNPNTVDLVIEQITGPTGPLDIANPCPRDAPCRETVECGASATTEVNYQPAVTIFDRNQGFVGVGVDLDAVYCSARVDCVGDNDTDPLLIVRDPLTGERVPTAVLNAACFRADDEPLFLYGSDVSIECDASTATLDPALGPGNLFATSPAPQGVIAASVYDTPGGTPEWQSFGLAVAMQPSATSCRLGASFSPLVSTAPVVVPGGYAIPQGSPVIDVDVALTNEQGQLSCTHHTLNEPGSGVAASIAGAGDRTLAHRVGSATGCEITTNVGGATITCNGPDATIDGGCALTSTDEIVTCNGVSAALDFGFDKAFRAITELQARLLAYWHANGEYPNAAAALTPSTTCCGAGGTRECPANPGAWQGIPAWEMLGFSIDTPHDFVVSYSSIGSSEATIVARVDADCNAVSTNLVLNCRLTDGVPSCTLTIPPRESPGSCSIETDSDGTDIVCTGNFASINNACELADTSAGTTVACGGNSFTLPPGYGAGVRGLANIQSGLMGYVHENFVVPQSNEPETPMASCCGIGITECPANPAVWSTISGTWDALGFSLDTPTQFVYSYTGDLGGETVALAQGDLDCDGDDFEYSLQCTGPTLEQPMTCTLHVPAELE